MQKIILRIAIVVFIICGVAWYLLHYKKGAILQQSINNVDNVLKLDQLDEDTRQEFGVIQDIANKMLVQDDTTRKYLILLQNNLELRPGGGFLGQFATVEVKNGEILSYEVEDSNNLDSTYKSDRLLPEKLQKYLSDTKKWKFRDSNYSPNFPTNVENALHFYGLSGRDADFDGVIAINGSIFEDVLKVTGPISLTEKDYEKYGEFTSEGGLMKLQKIVEEPVFRADERKKCENKLKKLDIPKDDDRWEDCQYDKDGKKKKKMNHGQRAARKYIIDVIAKAIVPKLIKISNIEPMIKMATANLNEKDIQLWFKNPELQELASKANWSGEVDEEWDGDYVMISDANIGALKSDYFMKRSMEYKVDFTGRSAEANDIAAGRMVRYISPEIKEKVMGGTFVTSKPLATARMIYENTALEPSYFNMDYHSLTRLYVPKGSKWYIREWFEPPGIDLDVFGNKQMYTYKFDVLLGKTIPTMLQYTLPSTITEQNYKLKIQKQSGIGNIPLKVTVITSDGKVHTKETTFITDTIFELKNGELIVIE